MGDSFAIRRFIAKLNLKKLKESEKREQMEEYLRVNKIIMSIQAIKILEKEIAKCKK